MKNLFPSFLVPTGPPLNFVATADSSTSMILTWEAPLIYERNGIIISYMVTLVSGGNSSTFVTPDEMLTLGRLRPFTSYMLTVSAFTSVGSGSSTVTITVTTPEDGKTVHNLFTFHLGCNHCCDFLSL